MKTMNIAGRMLQWMLFLLVSLSCNPRNEQIVSEDTEVDSARDRRFIEHAVGPDDYTNHTTENHLDDAVILRVDTVFSSSEDFENVLNGIEDKLIDGQVHPNEWLSEYKKLNALYSYQISYRLKDDDLWIQAYYIADSEKDETKDKKLVTHATKEDADFAKVWHEMETKASEMAQTLQH
jgi:hypothetical protein